MALQDRRDDNMNQQQIDALTVDQLWDTDGLATKACNCPYCTFVAPKEWAKSAYRCGDATPHGLHCDCKGTSRIWALPGMQEEHPDCKMLNQNEPGYGCDVIFKKLHGDCYGTGWVAKRDLKALLECLHETEQNVIEFIGWFSGWTAGLRRFVGQATSDYYAAGSTAEEALLRAVAQALLSEGAVLG